jgi:hypothetical protein
MACAEVDTKKSLTVGRTASSADYYPHEIIVGKMSEASLNGPALPATDDL